MKMTERVPRMIDFGEERKTGETGCLALFVGV